MNTDFPEFPDLLAAWLEALKTMDTKLNAYYMAVAALQNSQFAVAVPFFEEAVTRSQNDAGLAADMNRKYDSFRQKWEQLTQQSDFSEALASWLREFRLETPKQN